MKHYYVMLVNGYDMVAAEGYEIDDKGRLVFDDDRGLVVNANFWVSICEASEEDVRRYEEQKAAQEAQASAMRGLAQAPVGGEA